MAGELTILDADTLMATPMEKPLFVVEGLIPQGVSILCGAGKIGKSWLMLWLGLQVAQGKPVWGLPTRKCGVFYLCLEDTFARIQRRLYQLKEDRSPQNLRFAVMCGRIGDGLEEQLHGALAAYPDTRLVIIDTLQRVRDSRAPAGRGGMYASDYDDITVFKQLADSRGIAIVLVHHLRKQPDTDDPFNQISGTTGITGAVDTSLILQRQRGADTAMLLATGRDIEYQRFTLRFQNQVWRLVERTGGEQLRREEIPPFLFRVVAFMDGRTQWTGTATELLAAMGEADTAPNTATRHLARFADEVLAPAGIRYSTHRTGHSRTIRLVKSDGGDGNDG